MKTVPQSERPHRLPTSALLLLTTIAGIGGCGYGMSASDMRQYAIKRDSDPEEDESTPAAAPAASAVANSQPRIEPAPRTAATAPSSPSAVQDSPAPAVAAQPPSTAAAAIAPAPQSDGQSLSDTRTPPAAPLGPAERAGAAAHSIEQIAAALDAYLQDRGKYPGYAITDAAGGPLLSWRVALLPYLGHEPLYAKFNLDEPWNSPTNRQLLPLIPAVYQSPERFDDTTNFLAPLSGSSAMGNVRGLHPRRMEDGPEHTVFVIEANDELAKPWTQPADFDFDPRESLAEYAGQLRGGHALVAWGGGIGGAVPLSASADALRAIFTVDGGEAVSSYSVSLPLDEKLIAKLAGATASGPRPTTAAAAESTQPRAGRPAPTTASPSGSALAADYIRGAQAAWRLHRVGDALRLLYAADVADRHAAGLTFSWIPALKRPAAAVHIGVGVLSDTTRLAGHANRSGRRRTDDDLREPTRQAVGQPGREWLASIEQHAAELSPAELATGAAPADARDGAASHGPVTYLGAGRRGDLIPLAIENAVDVLVLLEAGESASRTAVFVDCELFDLARGKNVLKLPRVVWTPSAAGLRALARDEDYRTSQWKLDDFLADQLTPQPLPEALRPRHAVSRLAALADANAMHPLAALAEMVAYRRLGLISDRELLDGLRGRLGAEGGETLMLGSDTNKHRLLRQMLPTDDPAELAQLAEQNQRRRRDDD